jgi:hypothetical protein
MAFSFVQTAQNSTGSGTSVVVTLGSPATAGSHLVVSGKMGGGSSGRGATDNASSPNIYALADSVSANGFLGLMFYSVQLTGGATTITISWTGSTSARFQVDEYTGGAASNAAIIGATTTNSGSGTSGSGTLSPSIAGQLIVASYALGSALIITAGTNYLANSPGTTVGSIYRLSGTTSETMPATFSSTPWNMVAASFKPAAANNTGAFFAMF